MSDWGKGVNNNIGWGQGADNNIGWGSIYDKSNAGETLLLRDNTAFIIEVDTTKAGTPSDQFQFTGAEGDYDVVAKQNDTQVATFNDLSNQETITLPSSGVYILEVTPKEVNGFNRINFNNTGDISKILDIKQWGTCVWSSFADAFSGCGDILTNVSDIPDLSNVTSLEKMFGETTISTINRINEWNTSGILNMQDMFFFSEQFNQVLSFDTSSVTNMSRMFRLSGQNSSLSFDTSSVEDMSFMFEQSAFNQPLNFNTSSVTDMSRMFRVNFYFNQDIGGFDVSNVTDLSNFMQDKTSENFSATNYDSILNSWSSQSVQSNLTLNMGTIKHTSAGLAGRNTLINTYNWTITDGGQV